MNPFVQRALIIASVALLLGACGKSRTPTLGGGIDRESGESEAEAESPTEPPPAERRDYPKAGVEITAPTPEWTLLSPEEAAARVPGALAGAIGPNGCVGVVFNEARPEESTREVAAVLQNGHNLERLRVVYSEPAPFGALSSIRYLLAGQRDGTYWRVQNTVIGVGRRLIQVRAEIPCEHAPCARPCLDAFTARVELTELF